MKEFLDLKRNKSQVIPKDLKDFVAMLDNASVLNINSSHQLGQIGSDDYWVKDDIWNSLSDPFQKNGYIWADEIFEGQSSIDWNRAYEKILYANMALEGLKDININLDNVAEYEEAKGSAHFHRGLNFFLLAQVFCKQFNENTAANELGIPLKLSSNINDLPPVSTLAQTYTQILLDIEEASKLLPSNTQTNTRPSKAAAYGLLAKIYLQKSDYKSALKYADSTLVIKSELIDYNELDPKLSFPFPLYGIGNKEIIFFSTIISGSIFSKSRMGLNPEIYDLYEDADLRKVIYFYDNNGMISYKGSYSGLSAMFTGITTAEMLLIKAECETRLGLINEAKRNLSILLSNRYLQNISPDMESYSKEQLFARILQERRKELLYTGVRWHDLRRFNEDKETEITIRREINGEVYELKPNDSNWTWPTPPDVKYLNK